jgi:GntR family transcriptional repressor for pyruvate dehydrogenase complex
LASIRPPQFTELERRTAAADVVDRIKMMIAKGELQPGERLPSQRDLSLRLGISVATVREAINSLRGVGLLDARQGSGTYVTALEPEQLMQPVRFALSLSGRGLAELFDVRLLFEPVVARAAALRRSDAELAEMRRCVAGTEQRGFTIRRLLELDAELHDRISRASHNTLLITLMGSIAALASQSRERTGSIPKVMANAHRDHELIVNAIAARDGDAAAAAMHAHIENVRAAAIAAGLPAAHELMA